MPRFLFRGLLERVRARVRPAAPRRNARRGWPSVEWLPARWVPALAVTSFPVSGDPDVLTREITTGSDGNLWFTTWSSDDYTYRIGRMTPDGDVSWFPVPFTTTAITAGPDGNIWFTTRTEDPVTSERTGGIGKITPDGQVTTFAVPSHPEELVGITAGPDGNVWFTTSTADQDTFETTGGIGKITPDGRVTEYPLAHNVASTSLSGITAGPDGNVWFTATYEIATDDEFGSTREVGTIGRITPRGQITSFPLATIPRTSRHALDPDDPDASIPETYKALDITPGPDGKLWFTQAETLSLGTTGLSSDAFARGLGRIDTHGRITNFEAPTRDVPYHLVTGPDRNLWYSTFSEPIFAGATSENLLGRFTVSGITTSFPGEYLDPNEDFGYQFDDLTSGPGGSLWATMDNLIVKITPSTSTMGQMSLKSDHGVRNDDHVTNTRHPAFEGTSTPHATIQLYAQAADGGAPILVARTVANSRGEWRTHTRALRDGQYDILVQTRPPGRGTRFSALEPLGPFSSQIPWTTPIRDRGRLLIDTVAPRVTAMRWNPDTAVVDMVFQDQGGSGFFSWSRYWDDPGPTNPAAFYPDTTFAVKRPHSRHEYYVEPEWRGETEPPASTDPYPVNFTINEAAPWYVLRYFSARGVADVAGNALDGEFHGRFPSGDGLPGGDFVTLLRGASARGASRRLGR